MLVPSATWKAVYDPRANGAGVYVCENTAKPACEVASVAALIQIVAIDPFPAVPATIKQAAMRLPAPEQSRYAPGRRRRSRSIVALASTGYSPRITLAADGP